MHCTSERFNQTLVTTLSKVINDQGNDWDVHLDSVAFAYRTKQQSSTKKSPFELLYGVGPRLPPDLQNAEDGKAEVEDEDEDEEAFVNAVVARAEAVTKFIPAVRSEALENIEKAQGKQKRQYDLKRRPPCFDVAGIECTGTTEDATRAKVLLSSPKFSGKEYFGWKQRLALP